MRTNGAIKQGDNHRTAWLSTRLRDKRYGLSNAVTPHREGHYVPSVPDSRLTIWTETREEVETQWRGLCPCVSVRRLTCVWGVTVQRFGVLVHDVNQDDYQVCQADWIWNTDMITTPQFQKKVEKLCEIKHNVMICRQGETKDWQSSRNTWLEHSRW